MTAATIRALRRTLIGALIMGVFVVAGLYAPKANAAPGINQQMNFQGRLLTASGATVADGYYNMQFKIYQDGTGTVAGNPSGTLKWTESWLNSAGSAGVQVKNGYMSVQLGSITSLSSVDWNQDTLWLSINVGNTNTSCTPFSACGGDGEMLPMKRLSSTPYAFNAGKLGGLTSAQFLQLAQGVQTEAANNTASIAINKTGTGGSFLNLQANSVDVFTVANTGDISFGNNIDHTIGVTTAAASTAGKSLTISAGTAGTGAGPLAGGTLILQGGNGGGTGGNGGNVTLDAGAAASGGVGGVINIGTTNASAVIIGQNTTLSADKSLTITGSGTRPASPTEGMVYYDTTTKQLIVYSNGKWQADRTTSTKIVAASNSSQAEKDAADYVATGTGDQGVINSALTAAAGGKVYLTEGTFTINGSISVPNNTTLAGAGAGTVITIPNSFNADINAVTNTTTGGNGTGITIQDIKLEGNKSNQTSGIMTGIYFNGVGSGSGASAITGGKVTNIWVNNWYGSSGAIKIASSANSIISGNHVNANANNGIFLNTASNITVSNNVAIGNSSGIAVNNGTGSTFTGNTVQGNASGFNIDGGSSNNTFTGNTLSGNHTRAIYLNNGSANIISGNRLYDNGGATTNNAIYLDASDSNTITGNSITDSSATTTNYAINISNSTSDTNYLADNTFGSGTVNDLGTGTLYGGQSNGTSYLIQPASNITMGSAATVTTLQGNTAVTLNATTGTTIVCQNGTGYLSMCDSSVLTPSAANFIQNSASLQTGANFWIDGVGKVAGGLQSSSLDTISAGTLTLGGTNATSINLAKNVTVAAGRTLTLAGGSTASRPASPTEGTMWFDTTTKQLLVYSNGKWQADSKTATFIVAASDSSQVIKDGAQYVADGTADDVEINAAIAALPSTGGKVYLSEGTYNIAATVNINKANSTVSGAGKATVLKRMYNSTADEGVVSLSGGSDQLLAVYVDGNKASYTATFNQGVRVTGNDKYTVSNNWIVNTAGEGFDTTGYTGDYSLFSDNTVTGTGQVGVHVDNPHNSTIRGNSVYSNGASGIEIGNAANVSIFENIVYSNAGYGIRNGSQVTNNRVYNNTQAGIINATKVTENTVTGNQNGIIYEAGSYINSNYVASNTYSGLVHDHGDIETGPAAIVSNNTIENNGRDGISINNKASKDHIIGNSIANNGGSGADSGIRVSGYSGSIDIQITDNRITDTAGTGYAINIDAGVLRTYLSNNTFSGTGAASINDNGTDTVYANQSRTENGGQLTNRTANDTQAFAVQNAAGTNILAVDTTNSKVLVAGTLDTTTATTLNIGSANATAINIGKAGVTTTILGSTAVNPQTSTSTTLLCSNSGVISTCDSSVVAPTGTNFIKNQTGQQASANFNISGTGIASTLQAATFDTSSSATLNIGTTNATSIALNQNVTVAAGKSLTLAGGTTASRPASPTEGMMWYDTTTKQLLTYSNGKWQADSKTSSVIVAASNSPQAVKDGAQYVADGTNDQVEINAAITALTSGGKVYLAEGTYTIGAGVDMKTNIQLVGSGSSTVVQLANFGATSTNIAAIRFDSISNASVENFKLDGRSSVNTAGTQHGISVNWGSNVTVSKVTISNFRSNGVDMFYESNAAIKDNYISGNGTGISIYTVSSSYNSVMNNTIIGNTNAGISLSQSSHNTVQGNTIENNNGSGIDAETNYSAIAKNHIAGNVGGGVKTYSSSFNQITSNALYDNGGATQNTAIELGSSSSNNTVTNNTIADSSCTSSCYAVSITNSNSSSNYLADNTLGGGTVNDLGTGTIYAGQFASSTSFLLQPATNITIGGAATTTTLQGNTAVTLSTTTGTTLVCQNGTSLLSTCDASYLTPTATNFIQNGSTLQTGNFNISGTGQAATLTAATVNATTNLVTSTIDTASAVALTLGGTTASSVDIGKSAGAINLKANSTLVGTAAATGNITIQGAAQTVAATAGNQFILKGSTGSTTGAGGQLTLQGGDGGATSGANGGNVSISGGAGTGTGVSGLVIITTPTFSTVTNDANCFTGGNPVAANCTITAASVNGSSAVLVGFSTSAKTAILPNPTISTAGRVIYVTASNTSEDFTLSVNGGGQGNQIAMRKNTTATMIWNGAAWTAAGASSSTTMQAAYDNTLQSAGGAELVVSKTSATNGFTIRDAVGATAVNGALLTVQSGSAANLFSVNSNVTEYATDPGAEVGGAGGGLMDNTFPASTWTALTGTTLSRYTTAGDFIATGQGSVSAAVPAATANAGVANRLSTTLTPNMTYNVSFSTRLLSGTFTDMAVYYSVDGTNPSVTCATNQTAKTSIWTKVNCAFQAPTSGITANNAILIRQATGVARTFYVDNLSVTIAADYNYATDGDVDDSANYATNWTYTTGTGTGSSNRNVTDGFNASSSATATISAGAINAGIRNKLSINPLTGTLYRVSIYAKAVTTFNDFKVRYSPDGGTSFVDCVDYNTQIVSTSAWTPITCYIKTVGTTVTNPYVYFVEASSAIRTYSVDAFSMTLASNTTPNVQIGSGSNGGPTTLFTVDKGASAPIAANNDALLGSMYYDTTLGKLQCYESDGWGACGSSPDNIVTISPEYTNAVMHGTGIGTMTSDLCSSTLNINDGTSSQPTICGTNETYNFYKWTSPQATAQTYSIYVTYQLPTTFKEFASGSTSIMGRTDSTSSTVQYQIYRSNSASGMSACGSAVTVSTGAKTSWQPGQATGAADPSTCSFAGGDSVVFKISVTSSSNANAYVGNLGFTFSNR